MTIEVNVMCDGCEMCPYIEIQSATMYANDEVYMNVYSCKHIEKCRKIVEIAKESYVSKQE